MKSTVLFSFLLIFHLTSNAQIVGGEIVPDTLRYPWMVSIKLNNNHVCGGTLINERWVLTAAHCIFSSDQVRVDIGDYSTVTQGDEIEALEVRRSFMHPYYHPFFINYGHDIGLYELKHKSQGDNFISLAGIEDSSLYFSGSTYILGWGAPNPPDFSPADTLQQAIVPIIPYNVCNDTGHYNGGIRHKSLICAGTGSGKITGGSKGDSGGPALINKNGKWIQAGIASFGVAGVSSYKYPIVYTEVAGYRNWIDSMMKIPYTEDFYMQIYPNPATDKVYFQISEGADLMLFDIYDIRGAFVNRFEIEAGQTLFTLDTGNLSPGMYIQVPRHPAHVLPP